MAEGVRIAVYRAGTRGAASFAGLAGGPVGRWMSANAGSGRMARSDMISCSARDGSQAIGQGTICEPVTTANTHMAGFAADYAGARRQFRAAAARADADRLEALHLDEGGSGSERLSIDIAWFGTQCPRRVLLHSCGLHGVEGFAGSAIQQALLTDLPPLAEDGALVFVHALNPFGMANLRRVNEHNVDLNRNCLSDHDSYRGIPDAYRRIDPLLNPTGPPARDGFYLRAAASVLRHGYGRLRRAVAMGQYEREQGLFFGGRTLEPGLRRYRQWLTQRLGHAARVCAIDVHTGLGGWAHETLFAESAAARGPLGAALGRRLTSPDVADPAAYVVRGGLAGMLPCWLPGAEVTAFTQEFGTYPGLYVLHALREENRWHHYGSATLNHPSKARLRAAFCPENRRWRQHILTQGVDLARRAAGALFATPPDTAVQVRARPGR
jgi:hypothetical protein